MNSLATYISRLLFILYYTTLSTAAPTSPATAEVEAAPFPTYPLIQFNTIFFNDLFITTNDTLFTETYYTAYSPDLVEKYEIPLNKTLLYPL